MERKVGEIFNDGENKIEVVEYDGSCIDCFYDRLPKCPSGCTNTDLKFIKIGEYKIRQNDDSADCLKYFIEILKWFKGESKMDNKEELLKQIAEMEQREKDNQKTLEEMRKKVEKLEKEQPDVSATGVYLIEPELNKDYNYITPSNRIDLDQFTQKLDKKRLALNNCFLNKKQAKQEALRREGQEFIRRCAMLWNKDHDWRKDFGQSQYFLIIEDGKLISDWNSRYTYGQVHFDTKELAERCISELKAKYNEEQIKIIFGVK